MTTDLQRVTNATSPILPAVWRSNVWGALTTADKDAAKDNRSRLARYDAFLFNQAKPWHKPDLAAYRDHLALDLAASTVSAHLSTVRARYKALMRDRDLFYTIASQQSDKPLERKAMVDEMITRLENAIHPSVARVETIEHQDEKHSEQTRLTRGQASKLIAAPGLATTQGIRDTALIALALCTGLREFELTALDVKDLRQKTLDGKLSLEVRKGKGRKQRLVPYGEIDTCLAYVDAWLSHTGIVSGAVFRGLYKSGRLRPSRLVTRSVRNILARYKVVIDGELRAVQPHDLRRTYAARLFDNGKGLAVVAIQQNLGHSDLKTTLKYIGILDSSARMPTAVYDFDLTGLDNVSIQCSMELDPTRSQPSTTGQDGSISVALEVSKDTSRPGATADTAASDTDDN